MNNAAAINAVNRALAHYRRRQAHTPTNHSAREIAQMSMLAEYLHDTHAPDAEHRNVQPHLAPFYDAAITPAAASPEAGATRFPPSLPYLPRTIPRPSMDRTEATIRNLLAALPAPGYDLGILSEHGMYRLEAVSQDRFVRLIPYLKYRNANDAHVYLRPTGESAYTLLDDLTESTLRTLTEAGYGPAAVIETSHGSFQAWLRHEQPLCKELGTLAAKSLAARFGADGSAADWRRFGRAPAFTNRKPKYRNASGLFPFARLIGHTGEVFSAVSDFQIQLLELQRQTELDSARQRQAFVQRPTHSGRPVALLRFRESARYRGRPAAADMAFCIAAYSQGVPEVELAASLAREYLSRDNSPSRQAAYVRRTMAKASRWAA